MSRESPHREFVQRHNRDKRTEAQRRGLLLTLHRADDVQMRVVLATFKDTPYVRCQVFQRTDDGWQPDRGKLLTIKVHEIDRVIGALSEAKRQVTAGAVNANGNKQPRDAG